VPADIQVALVFAGGAVSPTARLRARLTELEGPWVVAADGGAALALAFGFQPHVIVGDFDSIEPELASKLKQHARFERHPRDKDATDGQLALDCALRHAPERLVLVGFLGGPRLDQALANVFLLATVSVPALLLDGENEALLLRDGEHWTWTPEPDEVVSLLPIAADAHGVTTDGLQWPLSGDRLVFGHTRGISNQPNAPRVTVGLDRGLMLVTRHFPGAARAERSVRSVS
jgi:thiamine pyrophosphokinase